MPSQEPHSLGLPPNNSPVRTEPGAYGFTTLTADMTGRKAAIMTYCVRTVTALNLRVGDTVIPDHGPHRRVTLHRLEGTHPVVVVQYEGVPGSSVYYPPSMPLLVEAD